jgi:prolyl oligopeptidase
VKRFALAVLLLGCRSYERNAVNNRDLATLCDDYWEFLMREAPTWATYLGDFRYNDRLADISEAGRARRRAATQGFLARLGRIDVAGLSEADRVTADILRLQLEQALEEERHKFWQWEVDQMFGPQADFPQLMNYHPLSDEAGLTARFRAFPAFIGQYLDNLRAGVREGRVAMRGAVERVIGQLKEMLAKAPEKSPFAAKPSLVPAVREAVYAGYRAMLDYLEGEYLPKARSKDVGLWALPGGEEAYRFRILYHTTLQATAEEIHRIGLEEVRGIQEEMRRIAGPDLKGYMARLKADPKSFFSTREEVIESARREFARADAMLPKWFKRLPRTGCEVKAIEDYREKDSVGAFYYQPDEKLTRKGIYYINTYKPESRPRCNMAALAIHEAVPGHHLQIALALEVEGLPRFRRQSSFTAFIEGWGLYSERLGDEMGLYEDDLSRFGMLTYQAWRAARLVVDTGLHALRWTRQQAIDYFVENVSLSEQEVVNEVDRYIIWPGQALAYMMGKREIMAVREEARKAMGPRFDIREFHDVVLRNGAIPLTTLRRIVRDWSVNESASRFR